MIAHQSCPIPARRRWPIRTVAFVLLALSLAACGNDSGGDQGGGQAGGPPPAREHLVEVAVVERDAVSHAVVRTGTLRARREVRIHTQEEGSIVEFPYFEGDRVEAGAVVARLDDDLMRAQLDRARATLQQAEADVERLRRLTQNRLVSEDELTRAETAVRVARADVAMLEPRLGYTVIRAPFTGLVAERLAEPGDALPRHSHLMTLIDPASLLTQVTVSELLIPLLSVGDAVEVRVDALGDSRHPGRIQRIHPTVDPRTRLGIIEVELDPAPPGMRPGQFARVSLTAPADERPLIPFSALRRDERGEYAYVVNSESMTERRAVRSGLRIGDRVEILDGLGAGEQVVRRGFLGLSADQKVRVISRNEAPGT